MSAAKRVTAAERQKDKEGWKAYFVEVLEQIQNPARHFILAEAGGGGISPHSGDEIHGWGTSGSQGEEWCSLEGGGGGSGPGLRDGGPGDAEEGRAVHISQSFMSGCGKGGWAGG